MILFNNFDAISICSLSFRWRTMNLRKSIFSSAQKRNPSCKDIKSSFKKGIRNVNSTRCSQKNSPKTPLKSQKSVLDDILKIRCSSRSPSNLNLLTSTPIPNEAKKRTRSAGRCDLQETVKLQSFNRLSSPITSSPIQKTSIQTRPCEVRLIDHTKSSKHSDKGHSDRNLRSNKKSSYSSLNTSVEIFKESRSRSTRSSMTLRPQIVSEKIPNDVKMPLSSKSNSVKKISVTEKRLSDSQKSAENDIVFQKESKKCVKKSSVYAEEFPMPSTSKETSAASGKSQRISITKTLSDEISWTSRDSLDQSNCETDNSKSSRYNLRNSTVPQKKSSRYSLRNSTVPQKKSPCMEKTKEKKSLSQSEKKTETSKSSECSLQLQNQHLSKRVSSNRLTSVRVILQDITKTPKSLLEPSSDTGKRSSRHSLRLKEGQLSKKTTINESSLEYSSKKTSTKKQDVKKGCHLQKQNQRLSKRLSSNRLSSDSLILLDITKSPKSLLEPSSDGEKRSSRHSLRLKEGQLSKKTTVNESSSEHSLKKTSIKKLDANKVQQNKTSKSCKKSSSSSKKQLSTKKSVECNFLSLQDIPIDDLVSSRPPEKRKAKSDGFKLPSKNTLKRKRSAIEAMIKADEDYEDDLYESKKFDQFKELLMSFVKNLHLKWWKTDTSDSERSFAVSTPRFPCTPLIRHKTPKFKDCFSPREYQISRKAAMEYIYRKKKRKSAQKPPETPVIADKKRLEYSQVLEDAQKLQKTIESLAEEESDNDSYFSF